MFVRMSIVLPEKLKILKNEIEQTGALLVCSDMYVIDGKGHQTADSITKVRRHHVFLSGTGLADKLLFRNFVTGCTMLMRTNIAKAAISFCPYMVHDHYLALRFPAKYVCRANIHSIPCSTVFFSSCGICRLLCRKTQCSSYNMEVPKIRDTAVVV